MNLDWVFNLNQSVVKDLRNITCFGEPHPNKPLVTIARFMKVIPDAQNHSHFNSPSARISKSNAPTIASVLCPKSC
jgi:hypothetical protein